MIWAGGLRSQWLFLFFACLSGFGGGPGSMLAAVIALLLRQPVRSAAVTHPAH